MLVYYIILKCRKKSIPIDKRQGLCYYINILIIYVFT